VNTENFDAAENFKQALRQFRIGQGEPADGLRRKIWESRRWIYGGFAGFGLLMVSAYIFRRVHLQSPSKKSKPGALKQAA
jgi:hypothetical protein